MSRDFAQAVIRMRRLFPHGTYDLIPEGYVGPDPNSKKPSLKELLAMKELAMKELAMKEPTLTAANARALTERSLRSTLLAPLLAHVHGRIQKQAEKGRYSINDPHADFPGGWPDSHVLEALWSALREQGYRVYDRPDPAPGHPCSKSYIEVQW